MSLHPELNVGDSGSSLGGDYQSAPEKTVQSHSLDVTRNLDQTVLESIEEEED